MASLSVDVGRAFYGRYQQLHRAQRNAIEPVLDGRDVLVLSPTGSGKTEAVTAPLVDRYGLLARMARGVTLLYITPARALANDVRKRLQPPLERLGLSVGIRHGERNDLARTHKPHVLITTPESLDVLLVGHSAALQDVRGVVLDEVHLTYNSQRGFHLAVLLNRLERATGQPLQVVGLSATVADAAAVWRFFRPGQPCTMIHDDRTRTLDYHIRRCEGAVDLVPMLNAAATGKAKVLLFVNSRRLCDRLGAEVRGKTAFGDRVYVHHASLDRDVRLRAEQAFQEDASAVCIATSTLELGIDIGDIDLVILYGHPGGWESFLQRAGRGNRRSDTTRLLCLVTDDGTPPLLQALAFEALAARVASKSYDRARPMEIYGAVIQQLLSLLLEHEGTYQRVADLADVFRIWRHLSQPVIEEMLAALATHRYVTPHPVQHRFGAGPELYRLHDLRLIWGNLPAGGREIPIRTGQRLLGTVPIGNVIALHVGTVIRFSGGDWRVVRVTSVEVEVVASRGVAGIEIMYDRDGVPLDPLTLETMLHLIDRGVADPSMGGATRLWFLDAMERLRCSVRLDTIPVLQDDGFCYFTFAGPVVNRVIARWAGAEIATAGDVTLHTERPVKFAALPRDPVLLSRIAAEIVPSPRSMTLFQQVLPRRLLACELKDEWDKTDVYARSIERLRAAHVVSVAPADVEGLQ